MSCEDIRLKIVVVGGQGVGKSSIVRRFFQENDTFSANYNATIGVDAYMVALPRARIPLSDAAMAAAAASIGPPPQLFAHIFDVSHAELHGRHTSHLFRGASAIVFVASLDSFGSLNSVDEWRECVSQVYQQRCAAGEPIPPCFLLLNKKDLLRPDFNLSVPGGSNNPAAGRMLIGGSVVSAAFSSTFVAPRSSISSSSGGSLATASMMSSSSGSKATPASLPMSIPPPRAPVSHVVTAAESRYVLAARARQVAHTTRVAANNTAALLPPRAPSPLTVSSNSPHSLSGSPSGHSVEAGSKDSDVYTFSGNQGKPPMETDHIHSSSFSNLAALIDTTAIASAPTAHIRATQALSALFELQALSSSASASSSSSSLPSVNPAFGATLTLHASILDEFCASAGLRYWSLVSARSGRSVHDALDAMVSIVLQSGLPPQAVPPPPPQPLPKSLSRSSAVGSVNGDDASDFKRKVAAVGFVCPLTAPFWSIVEQREVWLSGGSDPRVSSEFERRRRRMAADKQLRKHINQQQQQPQQAQPQTPSSLSQARPNRPGRPVVKQLDHAHVSKCLQLLDAFQSRIRAAILHSSSFSSTASSSLPPSSSYPVQDPDRVSMQLSALEASVQHLHRQLAHTLDARAWLIEFRQVAAALQQSLGAQLSA